MIKTVLSMFQLFMGIWNKLSDKQKEKIIDIITDAFEGVLRKYYRENKEEKTHG
ncbi:hypothetical protein GCM10009413_00580 [Tatumella punctata]